jgi:CMP-N,N'-diacetyllegionaminic acid synthase
MSKKIAFIPARSGSKRVPDKNIKLLNGHPLLAYSIQSALQSKLYDCVYCATDSEVYSNIAKYYGAESSFLRPAEISDDKSSDIDWLKWILVRLKQEGREYDIFSILRPTSPFRLPNTIKRSFDIFIKSSGDSIRAVEKCSQHPGKMWILGENIMYPFMPQKINGNYFHSTQYAALPEVYVQNASLEHSKVSNVMNYNSISGEVIIPFLTENFEGIDINNEIDWFYAEHIAKNFSNSLPIINLKPYNQKTTTWENK